jgi:hypothetical protein
MSEFSKLITQWNCFDEKFLSIINQELTYPSSGSLFEEEDRDNVIPEAEEEEESDIVIVDNSNPSD